MKAARWFLAVALFLPASFLISCGSSPPGEATGENAAMPGNEAAAPEGEPAAGQSTPPRNGPMALQWVAMEQVSPIVGKDGALVESLGLEMPGGAFQEVIGRGEKAPVTLHFTLATAVPNQREMTIHVLRGDAARAEENTSLGWYRIEEIPPGPQKETLITLLLRVADNAVVGAALMPAERIALRMVPSAPPPKR